MMARNRKRPTSQFTASGVAAYSTEQLSRQTWSDFERLFETHPAPGAYPCWCTHDHRSGPAPEKQGHSRAAQIERNQQDKKALVEQGHSPGILPYAQEKPGGWCKCGQRKEPPSSNNNP